MQSQRPSERWPSSRDPSSLMTLIIVRPTICFRDILMNGCVFYGFLTTQSAEVWWFAWICADCIMASIFLRARRSLIKLLNFFSSSFVFLVWFTLPCVLTHGECTIRTWLWTCFTCWMPRASISHPPKKKKEIFLGHFSTLRSLSSLFGDFFGEF